MKPFVSTDEAYQNWYHKLNVDRRDHLFLYYNYNNTNNPRVAISKDGGDSWQLATKRDFMSSNDGWIRPLAEWNVNKKGATVEQITVDDHRYVVVWTSPAHAECRGPGGNGQYVLPKDPHRKDIWYDDMYSMLLTAAATNKKINIRHVEFDSDGLCIIQVLKGIKDTEE